MTSPRRTFLTTALLGLTLALTACGGGGAPAGPAVHQTAATLDFGSQTSASTTLPGSDWQLSGLPGWISVTRTVEGPALRLTFQADPLTVLPNNAGEDTTRATVSLTSPTERRALTLTLHHTPLSGNAAGTLSTAAAPSLSREAPRREAAQGGEGRIIVRYRAGRAPGQEASLGAQTLADGSREAVVTTPDVAGTLRALRADPDVLSAVPDAVLRTQAGPAFRPGDSLSAYQWDLPLLGYGDVLADNTAGYAHAVTVAVIDTGVKFAHPDLSGVLYGPGDGALDLIGEAGGGGDGDGVDTNPDDPGLGGDGSHGTHVTGIIAARHNTTGVVGRVLDAPVRVLPVRVLGSQGSGLMSEIVLGIRYASGETVTAGGRTFVNPHPAAVINLSLGMRGAQLAPDQVAYLCAAVQSAGARGALVVAAAGNDGGRGTTYPAACPGAVGVAAATLDANRQWTATTYSVSGPHVTLAAPGGQGEHAYNGTVVGGTAVPDSILSADWDTRTGQPGYLYRDGTSMATPAVSALAALLLSKGVTDGPAATRARLIATAQDIGERGPDAATGAGLIDPVRALSGTPSAPAPAPDPAPAPLLVRIDAPSGRRFMPAVSASGAWTAFLPAGSYRVLTGRDLDGDGALSNVEAQRQRDVTLRGGEPQTLN